MDNEELFEGIDDAGWGDEDAPDFDFDALIPAPEKKQDEPKPKTNESSPDFEFLEELTSPEKKDVQNEPMASMDFLDEFAAELN